MEYQPDPAAQAFLQIVVDRYRPDKAALLLKGRHWRVAALHQIPTDDFWNRQHLSLGAIEDTIEEEAGRVVLDSIQEPDPTNLLSFAMATMLAAMTTYTVKESPLVIALTRKLETGVYKLEELEPFEQFVSSQSWR